MLLISGGPIAKHLFVCAIVRLGSVCVTLVTMATSAVRHAWRGDTVADVARNVDVRTATRVVTLSAENVTACQAGPVTSVRLVSLNIDWQSGIVIDRRYREFSAKVQK